MTIVEYQTDGGSQLTRWIPLVGDVVRQTTHGRFNYTYEARSNVRKRKDIGWKYPTGYSMLFIHIREAVGTWSIDLPPGNFYVRIERAGLMAAQYGTAYNGPTQVAPHIVSDALLGAMLGVSNLTFNVGQALAEANQTAGLIENVANILMTAIDLIKKRKWKRIKKQLGWGRAPTGNSATISTANAWLQYQYGWKPLLQDVYNAVESLAETIHGQKPTSTQFLKFERVFHEELVGDGTDYARYLTTSGIQSCFVRLDYLPGNGIASTMFGLGLQNPASLAYEVATLSFVADWFIPIGNALGAANYAAGIQFVSGSQSDWIDCTTFTNSAQDRSTQGVSASVEGAHVFKKLNRIPFISAPDVPLPQFRIPFPSGPKVATTVALLAQALVSPGSVQPPRVPKPPPFPK